VKIRAYHSIIPDHPVSVYIYITVTNELLYILSPELHLSASSAV